MNNAELIKALRYCAEHEGCDYYIAKDCPRGETWVCGADCEQILMHDAADALEAAEELRKNYEFTSDLLNLAIRIGAKSMTALMAVYEMEREDER